MFSWIKKNKFISLALIITLLFAVYVRIKIINGSLPYICHPDEPRLSKHAGRMLKTGDFNPHFFNYPSLPFYITATSFVLGYLYSVSQKEIQSTKEIGRLSYPFYSHPKVVIFAKIIFTLFSVLGIALTGLISYHIYPHKHLLYISPLLLSLSSLYIYHSANYLNVDIIGCVFSIITVFFVIFHIGKDSFYHKALIPGILCAFSIASKYTYFLILVLPILSIFFYSKKRKLEKVFLLILLVLIVFFVCVPYSLLDFNTFLDDIGYEIYHYKTGHYGFAGKSGLSQFFYYGNALIEEYGLMFIILTIGGIVYSIISKPKKGIILFSFPLLFLFYISLQRVHFLRNILVIYVFASIYCGIGLLLLFNFLRSKLRNVHYFSSHGILNNTLVIFFIVLLILLFLPSKKIINNYDLFPDSRNQFITWIKHRLPPGTSILVAKELYLDTRNLENKFKIKYFKGFKLRKNFAEHFSGKYILIPHYGYDHRKPHGKEIASRLNTRFKKAEKIKEFGKNPVLVNYPISVPTGDPKFYFAQLQ